MVWHMGLAAPHSEGMCNKLARDLENHLKENGHLKHATEKENRARAGGLWDPAAVVRSSEEARTAGARLRRGLDDGL